MDETTFEYTDIEVQWNGSGGDPWIDIDLHDNERPADQTSIVGRIQLTPDQALAFANAILAQRGQALEGAAEEASSL